MCNHIKFESCSGELTFRGQKYKMCSAGVGDLCIFDDVITDMGNGFGNIRRPNYQYEYNGNFIILKKSDYGRTKFYDKGNLHRTILYIAQSDNFYDDEKVVFITPSSYLMTIQSAIHKFNYDTCKNCPEKECKKVLVSDEVATSIELQDDLFSI